MAVFLNEKAFDDRKSWLLATGVDLRPSTAIVDLQGRILIHQHTGGMLGPVREEIPEGASLWRFGNLTAGVERVLSGAWWLEQASFEKLLGFSRVYDVSVGTAMRLLCLVPPEWSDASLLVRARTREDLLAWRGLANSVVTPAKTGSRLVRMAHQNEFSERRLHQLYIPGLADQVYLEAFGLEGYWPLGNAPFLYL